MKTAAFLGALDVLGVEGFECISGVSGGSILSLLLAVGYAPGDIVELFLQEDWNRLFADSFSFEKLASGRAPASRAFVRRSLARWLRAKGVPGAATFRWLERRRPRPSFGCFAADLDAAFLRRFDAASSPDVRVLDAVMAAISVPVFFDPVVIDGRRYVDAALVNNIPLSLCPERPLLALMTRQETACPVGWSRCLTVPRLRVSLLAIGELRCFRDGRVIQMPAPPRGVHLFRLDREALRGLLFHGQLALFASLHAASLLALLALAVLRVAGPA